MDIDRNNFKQHYPKMVQMIKQCDFIAFDCEFSGISTDNFQKIKKYDSDEDIYQKMKHTVQNYHLLQIGLCIYSFSQTQKKYIAHPYNIYLNPNYSTHSESIKKQMLQLECFNFMAANGLNFNKIYSQGLSYVKLAEREKFHSEKTPKQHFGFGLCAANQSIVNDIVKTVQEYIKSSPTKELVLECSSSFIAQKIIKRQTNESVLNGKNLSIEKGGSETNIVVRIKKTLAFPGKKMEEEEDKKDNPEKTKEDEEIDLLGFSLIVQAIIDAQRPIIGHYMGLDLFYFYDHFVDYLPNTFLEFVEKMVTVFPNAIDTKVLAKKLQPQFKRLPLHLEGLYKSVVFDDKCLKKFHNTILTKDAGFEKYSKEGQMHEAGFDSFITGVAFVGMCYYEKFEREKELALKDVPQRTKKGKLVQEYIDREEQIFKSVMQSYLDPKFPSDNLNHIFLRSGGTFLFDLKYQRERDFDDINHCAQYKNNTLFVRFDPHLSFVDIVKHFSIFGDVEINIVDAGMSFVEYEQFDLFEGIEDKLAHIIPQLEKHQFKIFRYTERKRFVASQYFS